MTPSELINIYNTAVPGEVITDEVRATLERLRKKWKAIYPEITPFAGDAIASEPTKVLVALELGEMNGKLKKEGENGKN